jgi:predicted deacylase
MMTGELYRGDPGARSLRVHSFAGLAPGPRLVVIGAVHGNETAGTEGIRRVLAQLENGELEVVRGTVSFVPVCNPLAYLRGTRMGDRNLNRRLQPRARPVEYEDHVANVLCPLLAGHDVLLDLHSFRTPGEPFVMRGPADNDGPLEPFRHAAAEARLAACLGARRIVDGWMDVYAAGVAARRERALTPGAVLEDPAYGVGTTEYMRSVGGYGVTLECGQHADPQAPEFAWRAIRNTLALLGLVDEPPPPSEGPFECLTLVEVFDRFAAGDRLAKPWTSFDPVAAGELIACRADGTELRAPEAGYIVFPDAAAQPGHEWFYFARPSVRPL